MNEKNTKYLLDNFPSFFNPKEPLMNPPIQTGFDCGDGWFEIIKELCEELGKLNMPNFQVVQVKEKLGSLRFYVVGAPRGLSRKVDELIKETETKSEQTCEVCGKPGTSKQPSKIKWLSSVLCDNCLTRDKY